MLNKPELKISVGQYSSKGAKAVNQDFHGICIPLEPQLGSKGIAIAIADGISSSDAGHIASESAVKSFLEDYYCTSDAWSVKRSAQRVIAATNSWLHAQTQQGVGRYDKDRGHVCTFSAMVLKSTTAHLFHVGDTRIYQLHRSSSTVSLEQLTTDHRTVVSRSESYLARALGVQAQVELDYQSLSIEAGDIFLLTTDGVHEFMDAAFVGQAIAEASGDLDGAARTIAEQALQGGSTDNLTIQIIRIDQLPTPDAQEAQQQSAGLQPPPLLEVGDVLDGFRIVRPLHASYRSHLYLAEDLAQGEQNGENKQGGHLLALKIPSIDMREDAAYLERFMMEEWVARRLRNPHVLKAYPQTRKRTALYVTLEYIEGQTLTQWMRDNPKPDLPTVRGMVAQIAKGLQAFHRLEMLHQDLRPENIMIDKQGTIKIIDFGATRVASVQENAQRGDADNMLGTVQYSAPEYLVGGDVTTRADIFSLGVMTYQVLTGRLPYGARAARMRNQVDIRRLQYESARNFDRSIPEWVDGAIQKAVNPEAHRRYEEVSEFAYDLAHPNTEFLSRRATPLIERNPVVFWKTVSALLALALVVVLGR